MSMWMRYCCKKIHHTKYLLTSGRGLIVFCKRSDRTTSSILKPRSVIRARLRQPMILFQLMFLRDHPEKYFFLVYKIIQLGCTYPQNIYSSFENKITDDYCAFDRPLTYDKMRRVSNTFILFLKIMETKSLWQQSTFWGF